MTSNVGAQHIQKMEKIGFGGVETDIQKYQNVKEKLGAKPIPIQIPIGAEEGFTGVVDLVSNKAFVWEDDTLGKQYHEVPIPEDLKEVVNEYRTRLIEGTAEESDHLLEKYLDDPDSISEDEIIASLRKATLENRISPVICARGHPP